MNIENIQPFQYSTPSFFISAEKAHGVTEGNKQKGCNVKAHKKGLTTM